MVHIHQKIDYSVNAYIVYGSETLLIHHKELNMWLPVGGHIELDEDPEQALFREIKEESGLDKKDLTLFLSKPSWPSSVATHLYPPSFLNFHSINPTHKHVGMVYLVKTRKQEVVLEKGKHNEIKWFIKEELNDKVFQMKDTVKNYCLEALKVFSNG